MTILTRALVRPRLELRGADPTLPWGDSTPPTNGMLGSPVAGVFVNEKTALAIAAVFTCVSLLADAVATLPIRQYQGLGADKKEIDPAPFIAEPYVYTTQQDWMSEAMFSLALRGNSFGRIIDRDRKLNPTQIEPIHPDNVVVRKVPVPGSKGQAYTPEYRFNGQIVDIDDITHIKAFAVPGALVGLNPIELCRHTFGGAHATNVYANAFFANSALVSGTIEVEEDLTETQTQRLARRWMQAHQGPGQAQLPAVLTGGATFKPISMNHDDAQFIETRQLSRQEIAAIFRVPPHMMGDVDRTTSWGTGIEQQELGFVRVTLLGWLRRFESLFNAMLPPGQWVRFDLKERLRGDTLQRFQAYTLARNGGWYNVDDVRDLEDLPPLPDGKGQDYLQPLNMGVIGDLVPNPLKPQPTPTQTPVDDDPGNQGSD